MFPRDVFYVNFVLLIICSLIEFSRIKYVHKCICQKTKNFAFWVWNESTHEFISRIQWDTLFVYKNSFISINLYAIVFSVFYNFFLQQYTYVYGRKFKNMNIRQCLSGLNVQYRWWKVERYVYWKKVSLTNFVQLYQQIHILREICLFLFL